MKTLILLLAMFLGSLMYSQTSPVTTGKITVKVTNANSDEGEMLFALYSEDNFLQGRPQFSALSKIKDGYATGTFENVPEGTYAVVILHDKNGNHQMDFDQSGMPLEGYGTSGNTYSYGPPTWEDSRFNYEGKDTEMKIRL